MRHLTPTPDQWDFVISVIGETNPKLNATITCAVVSKANMHFVILFYLNKMVKFTWSIQVVEKLALEL